MNKKANLEVVLNEMITAGQKMIEAANALRKIIAETAEPISKEPVKKEEPKQGSKSETETKTYTFQEVRGIMATLSSKGMKDEAKALLTKYGANRLSAVKEDDYPVLVAEAEALLNG